MSNKTRSQFVVRPLPALLRPTTASLLLRFNESIAPQGCRSDKHQVRSTLATCQGKHSNFGVTEQANLGSVCTGVCRLFRTRILKSSCHMFNFRDVSLWPKDKRGKESLFPQRHFQVIAPSASHFVQILLHGISLTVELFLSVARFLFQNSAHSFQASLELSVTDSPVTSTRVVAFVVNVAAFRHSRQILGFQLWRNLYIGNI